jgi:hypothetical protein
VDGAGRDGQQCGKRDQRKARGFQHGRTSLSSISLGAGGTGGQ